MADFKVARYTTNTDMPIQDGQVLVEKTSGLMSFDVGNTRVRSKYVYGTVKPISTNNWISQNGRYYIDITDLMQGELPNGYQVVGASLLAGTHTTTEIKNSQVRIYADDRVNGTVLVFVLPYDSSFTDTGSKRLVTLYHFEENSGDLVDCSGNSTITSNTGWAFNNDYKYGFGSLMKSSIGYIEIKNLETLDAFTIEWWQYDLGFNGDGGVVLETESGDTMEFPPVSSRSSAFVGNAWKHIAMVRKSGGQVYVYINGELTGFTNLDGAISGTVKFYGTQMSDGTAKPCYIDELAIFSYARYTENFDPQDAPYVGDNEPLITLATDTFYVDTVGEELTLDIDAKMSNGAIPTLDTSRMDDDIQVVSINGTQIKFIPSETAGGKYPIILRYPGAISKVAYISVGNAANAVDDTIRIDGDATYALNPNNTTDTREWITTGDTDVDSAITVMDESGDSSVYIMENEGAEGADRIWSTQ